MLGAGSLGSAMGAALAEAGSDVRLVNRNRAHVDAINAHGLRVRTDDGWADARALDVVLRTWCEAAETISGSWNLRVQ